MSTARAILGMPVAWCRMWYAAVRQADTAELGHTSTFLFADGSMIIYTGSVPVAYD